MKEEILALLKRFEDAVLVDKTDCFCAVFLSTLMIVWKAICSKGSTSRQGSLPCYLSSILYQVEPLIPVIREAGIARNKSHSLSHGMRDNHMIGRITMILKQIKTKLCISCHHISGNPNRTRMTVAVL